jgi:hypothetical protein
MAGRNALDDTTGPVKAPYIPGSIAKRTGVYKHTRLNTTILQDTIQTGRTATPDEDVIKRAPLSARTIPRQPLRAAALIYAIRYDEAVSWSLKPARTASINWVRSIGFARAKKPRSRLTSLDERVKVSIFVQLRDEVRETAQRRRAIRH